MALWVSFSDWTGRGSPFSSNVSFVGLRELRRRHDRRRPRRRATSASSLRNNAWYVLLVVPLQTIAVALPRACWSAARSCADAGFFRTAFYFPSVTSSVAITVLWLFLFSTTGVVNEMLVVGRHQRARTGSTTRGASSTSRSRRVGIDAGPAALTEQRLPRHLVVGLARRAVGRHVRVHPDGDLHDERHVHAAVHRRAAEHRRRTRRGRHDGRRQRHGSGSGTSPFPSCARRCSRCSLSG